jgi:glycosyltransferase involved in cell wall biosynthesis
MGRRRYVVSFANGPAERVAAMRRELREILPGFEHRDEERLPGESAGELWLRLMRDYTPGTIAHTAVLLGGEADRQVAWAALALAPGRMLGYDPRGDRYHLSARRPLRSWRFWRGWPVSDLGLLPWRDESVHFAGVERYEGRAWDASKRTVAVLSPYLPWPLSHGGAVRIYNLLKVSAERWNLHLLAFRESRDEVELGPLAEICCSVRVVRKPEFRRLRWASLRPAEAIEYDTPAMWEALREVERDLLQTEFTCLAGYGGEVLVEHDVTMDLAGQEYQRTGSLGAWWNWKRWERFERQALEQFREVVVMSEKDRVAVGGTVVPNGVDLERFQPGPEQAGARMLFVGSVRHYPNALAVRYLLEDFWPKLKDRVKTAELDIVLGPNADLYMPGLQSGEGLRLHGFVRDVKPLYEAANLVLIPTPVSAGTNIKALEALAMARAILATPSGVNGLELRHGEEAWVAEAGEQYLEAAVRLLGDGSLRSRMANRARKVAEERFDWRAIAQRQEEIWGRVGRSLS